MGVLDAENANRPSRPVSSRPTGQTASGYQGLSGLVSSGGGGSRPSYSGSYGNSSGGTLTQAYNSGFNRGAAAAVGAGGSAMRVSRGSAAISQALGRSVPASNPFSAAAVRNTTPTIQNTAPQVQNRANPVARVPPSVSMAAQRVQRAQKATANYNPLYGGSANTGMPPRGFPRNYNSTEVALMGGGKTGQRSPTAMRSNQPPRHLQTVMPSATAAPAPARTSLFAGNQSAGAGGQQPVAGAGAPAGLRSIFTPDAQQGFDPSANHRRVIDTLIAESNLQDPMGLISTAHVMNNRSKYSGASIYDVVSATNAFTGFEHPGDDAKIAMQDPAVRARAEQAFQDAVTGRVPDPTGGSDYFRTPKSSYGEELQSQLTPSVQMAGHEFFVGPKGDKYRTKGPYDRNAPKAAEAEALLAGNQRPAEDAPPVMTSLAAEQMAAERAAKMPYVSPTPQPQFVSGGIGSDRDTGRYATPRLGGDYNVLSGIQAPERGAAFQAEYDRLRGQEGYQSLSPEYVSPIAARPEFPGQLPAATPKHYTPRTPAPTQDEIEFQERREARERRIARDNAFLDSIEAGRSVSYAPSEFVSPRREPADTRTEVPYVPGEKSYTPQGVPAQNRPKASGQFRSTGIASDAAATRGPGRKVGLHIKGEAPAKSGQFRSTGIGSDAAATRGSGRGAGINTQDEHRWDQAAKIEAIKNLTPEQVQAQADFVEQFYDPAARRSTSIRDLRDDASDDKANSLVQQRKLEPWADQREAERVRNRAAVKAAMAYRNFRPEDSPRAAAPTYQPADYSKSYTAEENANRADRRLESATKTPPANPIQAAAETGEGGWMEGLTKVGKRIEAGLEKTGEFIKDPTGTLFKEGVKYALENPRDALRKTQSAVSGAFEGAGREVGKAMNAVAPRAYNVTAKAGTAAEALRGVRTANPVEFAIKMRDVSGSAAKGWETLERMAGPGGPTEMQKAAYSQAVSAPMQTAGTYPEPGYTPPEAPELVARALGPSGRLLEVAKGVVDTGKGPKATPKVAVRDVTPRPAMPPQEAADIENTVKATTRPSEGMAERAAQVADARNQPRNRQVSTTSIPYAGEKGTVAMPAGDYSSPKTAPWQNDLPTAITQSASILKVDPVDLAGIIHFESGFNPAVKGGKNGVHVGLIQFGVPEQKQYGITTSSSVADQMQAATQFALDRGFKPGVHGAKELYATINAGNPGGGNKSDTAAGGTWGTANEKFFQQMDSSRAKGRELLGSKTYTGGYGGTGTTAFGQNLQDVTRAMPLGGGRSRPSVTSQVQTNVNSGVGPGAFQPNYVEAPPAAAGSPVVDGRPTRNGVPIAQPAGMAEPYSPAGPGARETGQSSPALVASLTERLQSYRGKDHAGTAISRQEVDDFLTRKHTRLLRRLTPEGRLELLAHVGRHEHGGRYPPGPTHAA